MNLESYYYNCSPDYIDSVDPSLHNQIHSALAQLPKLTTAADVCFKELKSAKDDEKQLKHLKADSVDESIEKLKKVLKQLETGSREYPKMRISTRQRN